MVYAWGFDDWNRINAAHFYLNDHQSNSRKAYQIHQMFLTYLMQDGVMGVQFTSAIQNYRFFDNDKVRYGRGVYDYYLSRIGMGEPTEVETMELDVVTTQFPLGTALLDYRVAMTAACIPDAAQRHQEAIYSLPERIADKPFWDCTAF